ESFAVWAARTDFELSSLERGYLDASTGRRDEALLQEEKRAAHEAELERRSIRRLRILVAVLLGAGVIGSALTVFAFVQRSQAQQEAQVSRGGALISEAVSVLDHDPELAILLALEAAEVAPEVGQDAAALLHRALPAHRTVLSLPGSTAYPAPGGSWLVTGDVSGLVRSFDAASGELIAEIGRHDAEVTAVVVSSDGLELASGDAAGSVRIWDVQSGRQVGGWDEPGGSAVQMLRFTPAKGSLAVASAGGPATIRDRGGSVRTVLVSPLTPPDIEESVDLSADGTVALTPNGKFDVTTGERIGVPGFADLGSTHSAMSSSGNVEAGAGGPVAAGLNAETDDGQVWWDFGDTVSALTVDDAGERVAAGTAGGSVVIWEMGFGNTIMELSGHASEVSTVEFMTGERLLTASPDGTTRVWDLTDEVGRAVATVSVDECCAIATGMSGDGATIAVVSWGNPLNVFDTATGKLLEQFPWGFGEDSDATAALSRDGSVLVGAGGPGRAWNVPEAQELSTLANSLSTSFLAALTPNGDQAAFAVGPAVEVHAIGGEAQPVEIAADGEVTAVAYARDGNRLLVGDQMGLLLAVPSESYATERIRHPAGHRPNAVAFSLDGEQFAATWEEGGVSVFDSDLGDLVFDRLEDPGAVDVDFAGDGTTLAVLYFDGRLKLLDSETGRLIGTIADHTDNGAELATSDDGRLVATASWDGTVRLYTMDQEELFAIARSRLTRDFSPAECQEYLLDSCANESGT
ncbi:MAG: hypothetical protein QNJ77_15160, partial [Acidimicrobiia bacterium]|nr:hypothetical protein [Acidimicrobiia bacterium]